MKSRKFIKHINKSENLPQEKTKAVESRKNKHGFNSNPITVKETTVEKKFKSSYNTGGDTKAKTTTNITKTEKIVSSNMSSNLKQGTNSGISSQNKIPVSNKEETSSSFIKSKRFAGRGERFRSQIYKKGEVDKIIKIQRWWRRILAILNGYKIRESLFTQHRGNNYIISKEIYTEKYTSDQNKNQPLFQSFKNSNSYSSLNNLNNMKTGSRSYTNINNVTTEIKRNFNTNVNLKTSSSQNYIQTIDKRIISQSSPRIVQSVSTSPSVKSKFIIETKKVEVFRKPKNFTESKFVKENSYNSVNTMTNYEIKQVMRDIWNDETYCSTVESLCCLGDERKVNVSPNNLIYEEYEEEIHKLKEMLLQKDDELNNLMANLKETRNQLNVNISKNLKIKKGFGQKNFDQDAHELQIISTKIGWNDVNIPSPVNEIFIESFENQMPQRMQYIEGMHIMGKRQEESVQESITDPEAVLEIQEMNALSIISNKIKPKNMCQHLQSLMILAKRNEEQIEEYSMHIKEEKLKNTGIEIIPVEKEPLIFQKIEQINITSIRPKPRKPRNQIQELDGLEIINYKRPKLDLKRKVKPKFIAQNVDKICIKSLFKKPEKKNIIQELDGIEIIKSGKEPHIPQCVDELEIPREYDMLLVKPTWNSLQIQGSGLNLLAIPRDMGLENQEVDEFEILGAEKPDLFVESLEKISYEKPKVLQKVQVLIPIPENKISKNDGFRIYGVKKEPEIKIVEKIVEKNVEREVAPNIISKNDGFIINGIKKEPEIKIVEKIVEKNVEREVAPNIISKNDRFIINGTQKKQEVKVEEKIVEKVEKEFIPNKISKNERFRIYGVKKAPEIKIVEKVVDNTTLKIIAPNQIGINDRFQIYGEIKKIEPNKIRKNDSFRIYGVKREEPIKKVEEKLIERKIAPNTISNLDKFVIKGKNRINYKNVVKLDRFLIEGLEEEEIIQREPEPEENIEENVVEIAILRKPKEIIPNQIEKLERFGLSETKKSNEEYVPVKRKGFVEKIKKNVITKKEEKSIEKKEDYYPESLESLIITRTYSRTQPNGEIIKEFNNLRVGKNSEISLKGIPKKVEQVVQNEQKKEVIKEERDWNKMISSIRGPNIILRNSYRKVPVNQQQIIQREEILVYKNWNDDNKIIKTTKLVVKGTKKKEEKIEQTEQILTKTVEYDEESFAFNILDSGRKFRESLNIESAGFDLEGNKGMILKEGPAQTIKITKEQILIPSKILEFTLDKIEKPKIELKSNTENRLIIRGIKPKIKKVENIEQVQVETKRTIDWNDFNILSRQEEFQIIHKEKPVEVKEKIIEKIITEKKKPITLAKQRTNSIGLIGTGKVETTKVIHKVENKVQNVEVPKDWSNTLQAQRNAKFALLGKQKAKKYKLLVANGDKFFIMKESDDEIIYNDDYNSRKDIKKLRNENEGEKKKAILKEKEIIREKEFVPRKKREIRAQISRLKESESETSSSVGEIDVLASIRNKKMIKMSKAKGNSSDDTDTTLLEFKKTGDLNGYETKILSGEVVFTAKNGLGVNLGGTQYQKQINVKQGYTKKFTNKMSGIEIINPKIKNEMYFQKLTGSRGAIADGNYKIIGTDLMNKGLSGSISCRQMKIVKKEINENNIPEADLGTNGIQQSYRKQIIISNNVRNNLQNELNGQPNTNITNVILNNSRTKENSNIYLRKKDSLNSGSNNARIEDSPNSIKNNYDINQQMSMGKVVFNSRLRTDSGQNSPISAGGKMGNKANSTRREYEIKINSSRDGNEKIITQTKKTTEIKFKNKKTKNVEPLRDYDLQNNF